MGKFFKIMQVIVRCLVFLNISFALVFGVVFGISREIAGNHNEAFFYVVAASIALWILMLLKNR